ncbi:TPA: hypothetical protein IXK99_003023 [Enterococcus faecium]|nr:hypothetical protein [Enterococcus faecium]HAQ2843315.1 hypothetical protein [Enterococcus faecium]HAQ7012058.1 hypothetical protein [Enterococcus faecium]
MSTNKIAQLSLLSAACVAGRIAFQFIPNFQPMTAIFLFIVLYLSLKDALIVTSLSIAISSFYFGVGPWVIGQWISYTVVLSLFSIVCLRKTVQRNLWLKGVCFFLAGMVYGIGMTVFDTLLYRLPQPWIYYLQGVSFDLMHSIGNVVFFLVFLPVVKRFYNHSGGKNEKNNL